MNIRVILISRSFYYKLRAAPCAARITAHKFRMFTNGILSMPICCLLLLTGCGASCGFGDIDLSAIAGREIVIPLKKLSPLQVSQGYDLRICGNAATRCTDKEYNWPVSSYYRQKYPAGMLVETDLWGSGSGVCDDPCLTCHALGTFEKATWSAVPNGVRVTTDKSTADPSDSKVGWSQVTNVTFLCDPSVELPDARDLNVTFTTNVDRYIDYNSVNIPTKYACSSGKTRNATTGKAPQN
jgi:hypothetical protein